VACGHVLQTLADRFAAALDQIDTDVLASSMAQALDINGDGKVSVFALLFRCVWVYYVMVYAEFISIWCSVSLAWQIVLISPESAGSDG
jgi:hypothetical protein